MKSINDISAQLNRIYKAAYNLYILPMNGNHNKGWNKQIKARKIAYRYYSNIWKTLGCVCHSHDENITKQDTKLSRRIYAGY